MVTISIQVLVGSLPLVSTQRTSSSRISAAVPGMRVEPGLAGLDQEVLDGQPGAGGAVDDLHRAERVHVHLGDPLLHRGDEVEVRRAGQLGVDAALHADLGGAELPRLLGAVGDLVEGERVGVGVGAALGERAEPAADVADVGEVDVPVDDVGDLVADASRGAGRRPAGRPASSSVALGGHQGQRVLVGEVARVLLGGRQGGDVPRDAGRPSLSGGPVRRRGGRSRDRRPSRRRRRRSRERRSSVRPSVSTAACRSVRPDATAKPPSGSCQGSPTGRTPGRARPSSPASAATWPETRGSIQGSPARDVLGVDGQPGPQLEAAARGDRAEPVEGGPGPLGVHVVGGERGDAAPVVDAGAEQRPALLEVDEVGRRLHPHLRAEHEPGDGDRGEVLLEPEVVGVPHRGVGLGPEVLDDDFLHVRRTAGRRRRSAKIDSARSVRVSPMPISRPVVNGTESRPASSSTRSRTSGSLSGEP